MQRKRTGEQMAQTTKQEAPLALKEIGARQQFGVTAVTPEEQELDDEKSFQDVFMKRRK